MSCARHARLLLPEQRQWITLRIDVLNSWDGMALLAGGCDACCRVATASLQQECPELLRLSRLNHWLPGCEAHPEVVQGTAPFHYEITSSSWEI